MIFDNQAKIWGGSEVVLSPAFLGYLRLKYCLQSLGSIKGKVLEAGCGGGGFAASIKKYRPDLGVYAVDINKKAIFSACKKFPEVHFEIASVYALPYRKSYFDAVVVEDVLEHLDNPQKALKEVSRVLKPKGTFHTFVPLEGEWYTLHSLFYQLGWTVKEKFAGHIQQYTMRDIESSLEHARFKITDKKYSVHLLGQVIDVGYFSFLSLFNKNLDIGLEEELKQKPKIFKIIKDTISAIINFESMALSKIPSAGVHITAVKSG